MERRKASDFPQPLLDLFDLYVHGDIDRRTFLDRARTFAVGGVTAAGLLNMLRPNFAWAQQVPPDDGRIRTGRVSVESPDGYGAIEGYLATPADTTTPRPGILVIHENRGLNPYIEDVARRLAAADFVAFAPDGLTSAGGYPGDEDQARALFAEIDRDRLFEDFVASARWLQAHEATTEALGAVGFCFGGAIVNQLAVRLPDLGAAVPFYGSPPPLDQVGGIGAAVLVHHGEMDTRLAGSWPDYQAALDAAGVTHEGYVYPGAQHGFHNDTTPRFDEAAATLAWQRTLDWFNRHLGS